MFIRAWVVAGSNWTCGWKRANLGSPNKEGQGTEIWMSRRVLTKVEKVLRLFLLVYIRTVCHKAPKAATDDDVPGGAELFVSSALHMGRHVFLELEAHHGISCHLYNLLLHFLVHVGILDDSLAGIRRRCRRRTVAHCSPRVE